jgi:signal peptidase I
MSSLQPFPIRPRRPWLAAVLSLLVTGLGQMYCGRLGRGIVLWAVEFLSGGLAILLAGGNSLRVSPVAVFGLVAIAASLYSAVDAYLIARRSGGTYALRPLNRWYAYTVFVVVAVGLPAGLNVPAMLSKVAPFRAATDSMSPTIVAGDRVLCDRTADSLTRPARGELVVITDPQDDKVARIARIVGLAGDTVEIRAGELIVNGRPLPHTPVAAGDPSASVRPEGTEVLWETSDTARYCIALATDAAKRTGFAQATVPSGCVFVLGDNRDNTRDSRAFGPVSVLNIRGKIVHVYWPSRGSGRFGPVK